jgi:hypothetical protein
MSIPTLTRVRTVSKPCESLTEIAAEFWIENRQRFDKPATEPQVASDAEPTSHEPDLLPDDTGPPRSQCEGGAR